MKKLLLTLTTMLCCAAGMTAQTLYVSLNNGRIDTHAITAGTEMTPDAASKTIAVGTARYNIADIDSMTFSLPDTRFVGGDISMLPQYEKKNAQYYDRDGKRITPLDFFAAQGMNTMRVRLFVDPSKAPADDKGEGVVQDLDYVKALGKRIKDAGMLLMLDLHYSDTWTDPGQHATPSAWQQFTPAQLADKVYSYTAETLKAMKAAGAAPDFIQTGNEITYGMLWPTGHVWPAGGAPAGGSWDNLAAYLKAGVKACREECPDAKIVLQTEMGDPAGVVAFYGKTAGYGIDYDIIGLSYYPDFHGRMATLDNTLGQLETKYPAKRIMIVEAGYSYAWALGGAKYKEIYPYTEDGQATFVSDLVKTLKAHPRVNGLIWWWPEANEYGVDAKQPVTTGWWNASLFDNRNGRALKALYRLKDFK